MTWKPSDNLNRAIELVTKINDDADVCGSYLNPTIRYRMTQLITEAFDNREEALRVQADGGLADIVAKYRQPADATTPVVTVLPNGNGTLTVPADALLEGARGHPSLYMPPFGEKAFALPAVDALAEQAARHAAELVDFGSEFKAAMDRIAGVEEVDPIRPFNPLLDVPPALQDVADALRAKPAKRGRGRPKGSKKKKKAKPAPVAPIEVSP